MPKLSSRHFPTTFDKWSAAKRIVVVTIDRDPNKISALSSATAHGWEGCIHHKIKAQTLGPFAEDHPAAKTASIALIRDSTSKLLMFS